MINPHIPDWLRIALVILSVIPFIPQIHRIFWRKSTVGLSLGAVLCNLIVATKQFAVLLFIFVNESSEGRTVYTDDPKTTGDWVNFTQAVAVWICFLIYTRRRTGIIVACIEFLSITTTPVLFDLIQWRIEPGWKVERRWPAALFFGFHSIFLPMISVVGIIAVFLQARHVRRPAGFPSALSIPGLGLQAVVFSLVALSLIWRFPFPWDKVEVYPGFFRLLGLWYGFTGWVSADNWIFGLGQGVLLVLVWWRKEKADAENAAMFTGEEDETRPLLALEEDEAA
ncbi:hypothetical protein BJX70DRAFT_395404 [Aspergillus crustosus]